MTILRKNKTNNTKNSTECIIKSEWDTNKFIRLIFIRYQIKQPCTIRVTQRKHKRALSRSFVLLLLCQKQLKESRSSLLCFSVLEQQPLLND